MTARVLVALLVLAGGAACLGDPAGPGGRIVVRAFGAAEDSVLRGSPGRPLPSVLQFRATDVGGRPIGGAQVSWRVWGKNGFVTQASETTAWDGSFRATWVLGTSAADTQALTAIVSTQSSSGQVRLRAVAIPTEVAQVRVPVDTLTTRLGDTIRVPVLATDPFGNSFVPDSEEVAVLDTGIALPVGPGAVLAVSRGFARVRVAVQGVADTAVLHVMQRVREIVAIPDSLVFTALGDSAVVTVRMLDDKGLPVADTAPGIIVGDTAVVTVRRGATMLLVRSQGVGRTMLHLTAGTVAHDLPVAVAQVPERIVVSISDTSAIVDLALGALIPVFCEVRDRNGYPVRTIPTVDPSAAGRWTGTRCDSLRIARSGLDTLTLHAGTVSVSLPVALAVRPLVGPPQRVQVDSLPGHPNPWAPSARRNSRGQIELYFAAYPTVPDSFGLFRADLHRLISSDGIHFAFDGVALAHADDPCTLDGTGIENISIVPRADAAGWRMFYAAGSNECYGWQVLSAVSTDERTWTKEPGIRLSNGGNPPPAPPNTPPWPAGEGMVTDRQADGSWRMIVSTYEHVTPPEDRWQILEWRSVDQMNWQPLRTLVSTRDLPPEGQRSVYSPAIREFAPGMWRMIFTADDLDLGGRSRLWSAVSTDLVRWQLEGKILDDPGADFFYSTVVDEYVYTIQRPKDGWGPFIAVVSVAMP